MPRDVPDARATMRKQASSCSSTQALAWYTLSRYGASRAACKADLVNPAAHTTEGEEAQRGGRTSLVAVQLEQLCGGGVVENTLRLLDHLVDELVQSEQDVAVGAQQRAALILVLGRLDAPIEQAEEQPQKHAWEGGSQAVNQRMGGWGSCQQDSGGLQPPPQQRGLAQCFSVAVSPVCRAMRVALCRATTRRSYRCWCRRSSR